VVGVLEIERAMRELQHADVLNLRIARLVVFRHAGMHAFPAADAACQIQRIDELDAVHGPEVADMGPQTVFVFHLILNALEHLLHLFRREFLVVLLQELVHRAEILEFTQGRKSGGNGGESRGHQRRVAQKAAAVHLAAVRGFCRRN
jgi:hypothetical protein